MSASDIQETAHKVSVSEIVHEEERIVTYSVIPNPNFTLEQVTTVTDSSEKISSSSLVLSSILIRDAKVGRLVSCRTDEKSQALYLLYNHPLLILAVYILLALLHLHCLFEAPAVANLSVHFGIVIGLEIVYITCLAVRFVHSYSFSEKHVFWRDKKNWVVLTVLILFFLDILCYIIWSAIMGNKNARRWSRILRPLLLINFAEMRQVRCAFRNIRRTLIKILPVIVLFIFFIIVFGLLGLKLFKRHHLVYPNGLPYFETFLAAIWSLFVLTTTANNPDVVQPAYNLSRFTFIYFFLYMIINFFLIMNILLAIIYNVYRHNLSHEVQKSVFIRRRLLTKAFDLVSIKNEDKYVVTRDVWHRLVTCCYPSYSRERKDVLYDVLRDKSEFVEKYHFLNVAALLNLSIEEVHTTKLFWEIYIPKIYNSKVSRFIRTVVKHRGFRIVFDFLIITNAVCIGLGIDAAEWAFLSLFLLEILLKLYVLGLKRFLKDSWNIFDTVVIGAAFVATAIEALDKAETVENYTIDIILVLRVLRLLKIIGSIKQFKIIITTVVNLASSFGVYALVVWAFYYVFAILGLELFQGLIHANSTFCGNDKLNGTEFARLNYCSINFNDAVGAFVLLFHLLIVNQWHVITSGFVAVTSQWSMLYFFSIIFTFTFVIMNIVVAFIIEAFLLEYRLTKGERETAIEKRIKELGTVQRYDSEESSSSGTQIACCFHNKKSSKTSAENPSFEASDSNEAAKDSHDQVANDRIELSRGKSPCMIQFNLRTSTAKSVDTLLQHMFEHELGADDVGPDVPLEDLDRHELPESTVENVIRGENF